VGSGVEIKVADHNIGINLHASGVTDVDLDSLQARSLAPHFSARASAAFAFPDPAAPETDVRAYKRRARND